MTVSVYAIESALALLALGALAYGPWQWVMTDVARQKMFCSRDALFDMARAGEIDFASEEYRTLRREVNNLIRFAHGLTWTRVIFLARGAGNTRERIVPINQAIERLDDPKLRTRVQRVVDDIQITAVRMIFLKSPCLMLVTVLSIVPLAVLGVAFAFSKDFLGSATKAIGRLIQTEAAFLGS